MKLKIINFFSSLITLIAFTLSAQSLSAQPVCYQGNPSFEAGEILEYRVSYNWGLIWIDAADVKFTTTMSSFGNNVAYHFYSTGASLKRWDWLFKVRDTFEVYVNPANLKPYWHKRHTNEGGYVIHNHYHFDYETNTVLAEIEESRKPYHTKIINLPACTYDVLGATYVVRSIDFLKMQKGQKFHINMVIDDQVFALPVIYQGIETIRNRGGDRYECIAIDAILDEGTMFKPGEALRIWLSNDDNRIPVMMEAKVRVGSVKVYLAGYENLKYPLATF
jgi:hypothetical protein